MNNLKKARHKKVPISSFSDEESGELFRFIHSRFTRRTSKDEVLKKLCVEFSNLMGKQRSPPEYERHFRHHLKRLYRHPDLELSLKRDVLYFFCIPVYGNLRVKLHAELGTEFYLEGFITYNESQPRLYDEEVNSKIWRYVAWKIYKNETADLEKLNGWKELVASETHKSTTQSYHARFLAMRSIIHTQGFTAASQAILFFYLQRPVPREYREQFMWETGIAVSANGQILNKKLPKIFDSPPFSPNRWIEETMLKDPLQFGLHVADMDPTSWKLHEGEALEDAENIFNEEELFGNLDDTETDQTPLAWNQRQPPYDENAPVTNQKSSGVHGKQDFGDCVHEEIVGHFVSIGNTTNIFWEPLSSKPQNELEQQHRYPTAIDEQQIYLQQDSRRNQRLETQKRNKHPLEQAPEKPCVSKYHTIREMKFPRSPNDPTRRHEATPPDYTQNGYQMASDQRFLYDSTNLQHAINYQNEGFLQAYPRSGTVKVGHGSQVRYTIVDKRRKDHVTNVRRTPPTQPQHRFLCEPAFRVNKNGVESMRKFCHWKHA